VTAAALADASVLRSKLGLGAVGPAQIGPGAVGTSQLAPGAVGTPQLAQGSVVFSHFSIGLQLSFVLVVVTVVVTFVLVLLTHFKAGKAAAADAAADSFLPSSSGRLESGSPECASSLRSARKTPSPSSSQSWKQHLGHGYVRINDGAASGSRAEHGSHAAQTSVQLPQMSARPYQTPQPYGGRSPSSLPNGAANVLEKLQAAAAAAGSSSDQDKAQRQRDAVKLMAGLQAVTSARLQGFQ